MNMGDQVNNAVKDVKWTQLWSSIIHYHNSRWTSDHLSERSTEHVVQWETFVRICRLFIKR